MTEEISQAHHTRSLLLGEEEEKEPGPSWEEQLAWVEREIKSLTECT